MPEIHLVAQARRACARHASHLILPLAVCALCASARAAEPEHPDDHGGPVEEIVITSSPLARGSDELATPASVVDREHLLDHLGTSLGETLEREPGVHTSGFAPGASRPVLRGQDAARVRVLDDGIGTHDASRISPDHGVPINPLAARRVEILRGPAALRYGGSAIGGVVNTLSGRIPRSTLDGLEGELLAAYGFGQRQREYAFLVDGGRGPFALHFDGSRRESWDYEIPGTPNEQDSSSTDGYTLSLGGAWIGDDGRFGVSVSRFRNDYGIPGGEDPTRPVSIDLEKNAVSFEGEWNAPLPGVEAVRVQGGASRYRHDEIVESQSAARFDNDEWESRFEVLHAPVLGATGALGLSVARRDLSGRGEASELLAPVDVRSRAVYLFEEWELSERLRLQAGGRLEYTELRGTPASGAKRTRSYQPMSASVGLLFDLTDELSVGLNAAYAERAPEPLEIFGKGPHEATGTFEIGDPSLDEEVAGSVDLVLRGDFGRFAFEASTFYTDYDDYVFGRLTGATRDEDGTRFVGAGGELRELVYTRDDAVFYGGELSGHAHLFELCGGALGADAQFDFVRGRLSHGNVPRTPPLRWGGGVFWTSERVRLRFGVTRVESQDRIRLPETETGAYTMGVASAVWRVYGPPDRDNLELIVSLRNAFDRKARNHVSFNKEQVLLPGRSLRIALRAPFAF